MIRAPGLTPQFTPIQPYKARFYAPAGPNLADTIGRALVAGGADLGQLGDMRSAIAAVSDDNAGRARALQDKAAIDQLVAGHGALQAGAAVAAQAQALEAIDRIRAQGQAGLGSPAMVAAYDAQLGPAIDEAASHVTGHALAQVGVERQAINDRTMAVAQQTAASAWKDPARFVQGLAQVQALAQGAAGLDASEADKTGLARAAIGATVGKAVDGALTAGEPDFAAQIVGKWGDTMSPAAYQRSVARLGQAAQIRRMEAIFGEAAGGNPAPDPGAAAAPPPPGDALTIAALPGAAVHPVAGGVVGAVSGDPANATIEIVHPDGSGLTYGGLGLAAVATGEQVTPAHAIGSAGRAVTLAATTPLGLAADAAPLLRDAGGPAALIGASQTARNWDEATVLARIAQRQDLSDADKALAANWAQRRMADDRTAQALSDLAAGRAVVSLATAAPRALTQAADLAPDLAARMTPATLADVDGALRRAALAATLPRPDNATALRLELMQRQDPAQFAQTNLGSYIDKVHPADLSQLAENQRRITDGQALAGAPCARAVILDAMARHEFNSASSLPDAALPAIKAGAEAALRLNQTDLADRPTIDSAVAHAIQNQGDCA